MGLTNASPKAFGLAITAAATLALTTFAFPAPAHAEDASPAASPVTVSYADLDLSSPADAKRLLKRIRLASIEACGLSPNHSPLSPRAPAKFRVCVAEATDTAVAKVNAPLLAELHNPTNQTPAGALIAAR